MDEVKLLVSPIPGCRLLTEGATEEGAILALRAGGNEALFGSLQEEKRVGLAWIPVTEFSVDPAAIEPMEVVEEGEEPPAGEPEVDGPVEETQPPGVTPFGRKRPGIAGR